MQIFGFTKDGMIDAEIDGVRMFVPDDMENRDRQAIAEWEASGNMVPAFTPPLLSVKSVLMAQIDSEAEACRLRYITGGAGQAMTYQQKATEAADCLAQSNPQPDDFPLLAAEIGITAETLLVVARVVFDAHQGWRQVGATIEALRLSAKQTVAAAETAADALSAAQIDWP